MDRSAFDKILQAGGFVSINTGGVPDANAIPIPKTDADESMDAAACIGCGACVATCKNGSAMLFVAARVSSLAKLPQGRVEGARRAKAMVAKMDELGFGDLYEYRCLRGRVPERYFDRTHRPPEPRIPVCETERLIRCQGARLNLLSGGARLNDKVDCCRGFEFSKPRFLYLVAGCSHCVNFPAIRS